VRADFFSKAGTVGEWVSDLVRQCITLRPSCDGFGLLCVEIFVHRGNPCSAINVGG